MKLYIPVEPTEDLPITLSEDGGIITVSAGDWSLFELRVSDGKLCFARCENIEDKRIATDKGGFIKEVDE